MFPRALRGDASLDAVARCECSYAQRFEMFRSLPDDELPPDDEALDVPLEDPPEAWAVCCL